MNESILSNLRFRCDPRLPDGPEFLFFQATTLGEQNDREEYSLAISCSIIWSILHSVHGNEKNMWTERFWGIFISPMMFDHLIYVGFSSWKWTELLNRSILSNLHLVCGVRLSDLSRSLFFEMGKIDEENCAEKSSFDMWCLIIWSMSVGLLQNEQNRWTQLSWGIFIDYVRFDHFINLAFLTSKWRE